MANSDSQSGISVYPRLPVPQARSEPRPPPPPPLQELTGRGGRADRRIILMVAAAGIAGGTGAWFLQPAIAPDARISVAARRASDADQAASAQKDRADALEKSFEAAAKAKRDVEAKLALAEVAEAELAHKAAAEANQHTIAEVVRGKLKAAAEAAADSIAIEGAEVHLRIADRVLFKPNDDALTDRGKQVLTKVAAALKELPDQRVWVQGHTDEQPVAVPRAPAPPPVPAKKPGKLAAVVPVVPVVRFPTNWELSAARALSVVHYFQDVAKLEPGRLAALAFGAYAPVSKKDKARNRRLEIVVAPRPLPAK
jgi:chemotaxis protein MotB